VVTFRENPVEEFRAVTVAPETTAPFGSATVPDRSDALVAAWPKAKVAAIRTAAKVKMVFPMRLEK
jgi:hypothetical protein